MKTPHKQYIEHDIIVTDQSAFGFSPLNVLGLTWRSLLCH